MAERRELFDIPLEKRREAFVRNRFGQEDVFGRPDIAEWLETQRKAGRPDVEVWPRIISRGFLTMCAATAPITHLRERATTRGALHLPGSSLGVYGPIYGLLDHGLYWGHRDVGVFVNGDATFMVSGADDKLTIDSCDCASAVIDVLFAEWEWDRPKWSEARAFLCDALAEEIKRERAKAEHDFDTAVAVSADGTKIVHADWVVVAEICGGRLLTRIYPATAFHSRKCIRAPEMPRHQIHVASRESAGMNDIAAITNVLAHTTSNWLTTRWRHNIASSPDGSFQDLMDYRVEKRFLLTTADFCPSPLPDGGVEVTV